MNKKEHKMTKKECNLGGDAEHCEDCSYYPDYKFDEKTGECMRNDLKEE